ncbi:MAG TPA: hypothetical protein VN648_03885 [Candidatus Methylomirabilis sp.]|nr:hypothetical protein [Candidatus Methylomirabilis sp.]
MPKANVSASDPKDLPGRLFGLLMVTLALILFVPSPFWAAEPLRRIPTVVHVHSTWSSGNLTLDELIARARATGVEAIFLTENHLLQFEYGLPPLRNLLRYRVEFPSLLSRGPAAFLQAVQEANGRQKDVLLVPGAQVIPHYYWTGSLLGRTLTLHDTQKDILALGLYRAEDYQDLPAVGNPAAARWGMASLWLLSPAFLVVPGAWLFRVRHRRVVRLQHFRVTVDRRFTACGILCLAISALFLADGFPFRMPPVSPYDPEAGLQPHQAVIDFVIARGGISVWSLPEARDHPVVSVLGMRATVNTDPYPSDLLRTDRFTAFGGIYEDTTSFTEPGGRWDRLLADYLAGRRVAPAWAIGEAAYHAEGQAGKRLGTIQTVLLVTRKDSPALTEALRSGRFYALHRTPEAGLVLDQFQLLLPHHPPVEAGEQIALCGGGRPEIRAAIHATDDRPIAIEARLVRNGIVVQAIRGETPLLWDWKEPALPADSNLFYRLEVRGPVGHRILSNPIFLRSRRGSL